MKREARVSFKIPFPSSRADQGHRFGINALAVGRPFDTDNGNDHESSDHFLYSGGRDSTIKCWSGTSKIPRCHFSLEQHSDWVNDLVVLNDERHLVSCSSDATVRVWDLHERKCTQSIRAHSDYAKCLAYSATTGTLVSAGLDHRILIWDVERSLLCPFPSTSAAATPSEPSFFMPLAARNSRDSVYSLAISASGSLIASGSASNVVRLWDARTGRKVGTLRGHHDNVRALLVNDDATAMVSGSSDCTVKYWDLRHQRNTHTFRYHSDSVWSMCFEGESRTRVVTAGRDGHVHSLDTRALEHCQLFAETNPITKVVLTGDRQYLWTASSDSAIKRYDYKTLVSHTREKVSKICGSASLSSSFLTARSSPAGSPATNGNASATNPSSLDSVSPSLILPGLPGIERHQVLNNRRHVLTKDTAGSVALWDVTKGDLVRDLGCVDFDTAAKELFEMISVPNWFSIDTKLGCVTVHLDPPQCFATDVYASECGFDGGPDDEIKANLGLCVLRGLFSNWLEKNPKPETLPLPSPTAATTTTTSSTSPDEKDAPPQPPAPSFTLSPSTAIIMTNLNTTTVNTSVPSFSVQPLSSALQQRTNSLPQLDDVPPVGGSKPGSSANLLAGKPPVVEESDESEGEKEGEFEDYSSSDLDDRGSGGGPGDRRNSFSQRPGGDDLPPSILICIGEDGLTCWRASIDPKKSKKIRGFRRAVLLPTAPHSLMRRVSEISGEEKPGMQIPKWVVDALYYGYEPSQSQITQAKIGFFLKTADEGLPDMPQAQYKLNANRMLRVKKVATYVTTNLKIELPTRRHVLSSAGGLVKQPTTVTSSLPTSGTESSENLKKLGAASGMKGALQRGSAADLVGMEETHSASKDGAGCTELIALWSGWPTDDSRLDEQVRPEEYVEVLCNDKVVPPTLNLGTAKQFFRKAGSGPEVHFHFRRRFPFIKPKFLPPPPAAAASGANAQPADKQR